ncbi:MAG: DUF1223 domain-containing protein [Bryobacteraceae bacterium]|jgi:hypothetical protein
MKRTGILILSIAVAGAAQQAPMVKPVLVELFTSEGCSSCPPADALLARLDRFQPVPGVQIVALEEHVDYWNHDGWTDPFSSAQFSRRQERYAEQFAISDVYTPQMVVDGFRQFNGSDSRGAVSAIGLAARTEKLAVRVLRSAGGVRVEVDPGSHGGDVFLAVAQNAASSQVLAGENQGRSLRHVAILRRLSQIGSVKGRAGFAKDVPLSSSESEDRVIAFVQDSGPGRVRGAAMSSPEKTKFQPR